MLNDAVGFEKIFIATGYTDLRRGIDGLASTIKFQFDLDPFQTDKIYLVLALLSYRTASTLHPLPSLSM